MRAKKFWVLGAAFALATSHVVIADSDTDEVELDHDMAVCAKGAAGPALLLTIEDLKDEEGNIRAQIYGSNPEDFLEKGKKLVRIDVPTEGEGQQICVPLPSVGRYSLVVLHDRNANGKADFFSEGFGFSNNPKLSLAPPDAEEVMFDAKPGITGMTISLTYIFGGDEEQTKKRRQLRRR